MKPGGRLVTVLACAIAATGLLSACQQKADSHEDILRAGLAEILSHQETGCGEVESWTVDGRLDYLVNCENGLQFRIHVGNEGHVNVNEHRSPPTQE